MFLLHGTPRKLHQRGRNSGGVGFLLSPAAVVAWEAAGASFVSHPASDGQARFASIRVQAKDTKRRLVTFSYTSGYLPDQSHEATYPLESALVDLGEGIAAIRQTGDITVIGLDANAQIGNAKNPGMGKGSALGPHGPSAVCARGLTLYNFLLNEQLSVLNTFFYKRSYFTKFCNLHKKYYSCDYLLVSTKDKPRVTDCQVGHSAPLSSHFPLSCNFRVAAKLRKFRPKKSLSPRIEWLGLRDETKERDFKMKSAALCPPDSTSYPEISSAIVQAAEETLAAPRPQNPSWFKLSSSILLPLIDCRDKSQAALKLAPTPANFQAYSLCRKELKRATRQAKLRWLRDRSDEVNRLGTHPRHAWLTIQTLMKGLDFHHTPPPPTSSGNPTAHSPPPTPSTPNVSAIFSPVSSPALTSPSTQRFSTPSPTAPFTGTSIPPHPSPNLPSFYVDSATTRLRVRTVSPLTPSRR